MTTDRSREAPIISVAILHNGIIHSMPKPKRHCDVVQAMAMKQGTIIEARGEQGFLDADGLFLTRKEAVVRAKATGQIKEPKFQPNALFSEDLW